MHVRELQWHTHNLANGIMNSLPWFVCLEFEGKQHIY